MGVEPLTHPAGRTTEPLHIPSPGADSHSAATSDTQPGWSDHLPAQRPRMRITGNHAPAGLRGAALSVKRRIGQVLSPREMWPTCCHPRSSSS